MNNIKKPSPEILQEAILQLNEPILFKGFINNEDSDNNWRLLELSNLTKLITDDDDVYKLPFRVGINAPTPNPQWDISCPVITMNMSEFISKIQGNDSNEWYYFDYKYMNDWFQSKPELLNAVNWRYFGFDKGGADSTLWIGSKGAHTNCHQDSYGCNLIAQVHGSKQWLLFPPESGNILKETRIPYEESTIYSKINFFCPSKEDEDHIMNSDITHRLPKLTVLNPGDALLVPKGWWHYVESLDLTVSVNVWLSLKVDYEARIKESLVKWIMTGLGEGLPTADKPSSTLQTCLELIGECNKQYHELQQKTECEYPSKKRKDTLWNAHDFVAEYPEFVKKLDNLTEDGLREFLMSKRDRFSKCHTYQKDSNFIRNSSPSYCLLERLVNTLCCSDNIDRLSSILLTHK